MSQRWYFYPCCIGFIDVDIVFHVLLHKLKPLFLLPPSQTMVTYDQAKHAALKLKANAAALGRAAAAARKEAAAIAEGGM